MFYQNCSQHALLVIALAAQKATELQQQYAVGTEHLLLALIAYQNGLAATALAKVGLSFRNIGQVEAKIAQLCMPGDPELAGIRDTTDELSDTLVASEPLAHALGHTMIGTEHLLLAQFYVSATVGKRKVYLFNPDSPRMGPRILRDLGIDIKILTNEVMLLLEPPPSTYV